jgi:hypothetical protein
VTRADGKLNSHEWFREATHLVSPTLGNVHEATVWAPVRRQCPPCWPLAPIRSGGCSRLSDFTSTGVRAMLGKEPMSAPWPPRTKNASSREALPTEQEF